MLLSMARNESGSNMAGNAKGGLKAAKSNKDRHGDNFYKRIGALGGAAPTKLRTEDGKSLKGFALNPEAASRAGRIGGKKSKRGKAQ